MSVQPIENLEEKMPIFFPPELFIPKQNKKIFIPNQISRPAIKPIQIRNPVYNRKFQFQLKK